MGSPPLSYRNTCINYIMQAMLAWHSKVHDESHSNTSHWTCRHQCILSNVSELQSKGNPSRHMPVKPVVAPWKEVAHRTVSHQLLCWSALLLWQNSCSRQMRCLTQTVTDVSCEIVAGFGGRSCRPSVAQRHGKVREWKELEWWFLCGRSRKLPSFAWKMFIQDCKVNNNCEINYYILFVFYLLFYSNGSNNVLKQLSKWEELA